jgi:N-acetylgalactosamine-N,N'-diacetylbacillosaminyl-diphospho-undecaprenol 4-alpha-N-acetylgalactosaminyltransferase
MKKKKVAIFIISLCAGGAERVVSILLNNLKEKFDVYLIMLQPVIEYEIPSDQKIILLDTNASNNALFNILKIPFLSYRYYRFLKKNNIDRSISFLNRPNFIAGFLKKIGWKGKIILCERTFTSDYYSKRKVGDRVGRLLVKKLYSNASLIVCNSKSIETDLRKTFNVQTNFRTIYNPIDLDDIKKKTSIAASSASKETQSFTFITIGRLNYIKNQEMLIEAGSLLRDIDFKIKIIGRGELKENLNKIAIKYNIADRVSIIDYTDNPFTYLTSADCFVLTSNFEGFPNVVLEALACSLPVISTDCKGGIRELLAPSILLDEASTTNKIIYADYGMLVPVGNAKVLAGAMRKIYYDFNLRQIYRAKGYERAINFDLSKIIKSFQEVLE